MSLRAASPRLDPFASPNERRVCFDGPLFAALQYMEYGIGHLWAR
jgi:hypothetical protein